MKRTASIMDEDLDSVLKKRHKPDSGSCDAFPSEIWQDIAKLILHRPKHMNRALRCQTSLSLTCKNLYRIVATIRHQRSSQLWPTFYEKVLKPMGTLNFNQMFNKLNEFGARKLEVWDGEFNMLICPIDDKILHHYGEFGGIYTCESCVKTYGEDWRIIWHLDYDSFICGGCQKQTPFTSFKCELCQQSYCKSCQKDKKFPGVVYCAEDSSYCKNCATFCHHCADWGALKDEMCENCGTHQCERCADRGCSVGDKDSDSYYSGGDDDDEENAEDEDGDEKEDIEVEKDEQSDNNDHKDLGYSIK